MPKPVLIISDNPHLVAALMQIIDDQGLADQYTIDFACSPLSGHLLISEHNGEVLQPLDIKKEYATVAEKYGLVISLHCKQLFPGDMVSKVRCVNVHPGYNPHNRGWFPQVFSIINGLPLGATIHEIDEQLDHGSIIVQKKIKVEQWDTSYTAYNKVVALEIEMLRENFKKILDGDYITYKPEKEGNVNLKKDFNALCEIDLNEKATYGELINRLRALSHNGYENTYFIDSATGKKVYIKFDLEVKE